MRRKIEFYWLDEPDLDGKDNSGWVALIDGSTDGHVADVPEDLPREASPEAVVAAWLRRRQPLGAPCLACGQAAPERDQLIAQLAGEGKTNEEIGAATGLGERQVTRILYRLGFRRPRGRPAKQTA